MKGFLILAWCLSIGFAVFCRPAAALAAPTAVVAVEAICVPFEDDCATQDDTFVVSSAKVSINGAGAATSTCQGKTTVKPSKATKCDGETLNGGTGDSDPQFACAMVSNAGGSAIEIFTDDWTETITPSGHVTMKCSFKPNEQGK